MKKSLIGETIDNYQILEEMGRGGMGVVFKVKDNRLNKEFAIKMMSADLMENASLLRRFETEAQALAKLEHPNIVTIYRLAESDWGPFFVMQLVKGKTLADVIKESGPVTLPRFFKIFRQSLSALAYAHREEIIHRDIKPGNIMLTASDDVKITDFGLAKVRLATNVTRTMTVGGTLTYMSPEQIQGLAMVDHRGDLYSLGMTMYEALAGTTPFADIQSDYRISKMIIEGSIPSVAKLRPALSREVVYVVMKALCADRNKRFQSADEMLEALNAAEARMNAPPRVMIKPTSRSSAAIAIGVVSVILIGVYAWTLQKDPATEPVVNPSKQILLLQGKKDSTEEAPKQIAPTGGKDDAKDTLTDKATVPLKSVLTILSVPRGASVFFDKIRVGSTPLVKYVEAGRRQRVRLTLSGYEPKETTVVLQRQASVTIWQTLKKVDVVVTPGKSIPGRLFIETIPANPEVLVDRKSQTGKSPYSIPPDRNVIVRINSGTASWVRTLNVKSGQELRLPVLDFTKKLKIKVVAKRADGSGVPGCEIILNGVPMEIERTPRIISVPFGVNTIKVRNEELGESDVLLECFETDRVNPPISLLFKK